MGEFRDRIELRVIHVRSAEPEVSAFAHDPRFGAGIESVFRVGGHAADASAGSAAEAHGADLVLVVAGVIGGGVFRHEEV
jgi:hypothetical protein